MVHHILRCGDNVTQHSTVNMHYASLICSEVGASHLFVCQALSISLAAFHEFRVRGDAIMHTQMKSQRASFEQPRSLCNRKEVPEN